MTFKIQDNCKLLVMSFNLSNVSNTFMRLVNLVLKPFVDESFQVMKDNK